MKSLLIVVMLVLGAVTIAAYAVNWKDSQAHLTLVKAGMLPAQVEQIMGKQRGPICCDGARGFARMEWGYRAGLIQFVNGKVTEIAFRPKQNPSFPRWNFYTP